MEILAFLPPRQDGWGNEHHHEFHSEFIIEACRHLGTSIRTMSWRQLEAIENFEDTTVVDLNENLLCVDNYFVHYALTRGAQLMDPIRGENGSGQIIRLSPFHGIYLAHQLPGQYALGRRGTELDQTSEYLATFEAAMRSEANRRFPWPEWFLPWAESVKRSGSTKRS